MVRLHRSLVRRAGKIDADKVANKAEDYIEGFKIYKDDLKGVRGLATADRMKNSIKKIDKYEREVARLEDKIDTILYRRNVEAARLEGMLNENLDIVGDYVNRDEYQDFLGG